MDVERCVCVRSVAARGYCFLEHDVFEDEAIFLHIRETNEGTLPEVGEFVDCTVQHGEKGLYATNATIVAPVSDDDDDDDNPQQDLNWHTYMRLRRHGPGSDGFNAALRQTLGVMATTGAGLFDFAAVAVADQSGFPVDNFVKSLADPSTPHAVDDDFVCTVCLDVQRQATLLVTCGHSFCRGCIEKVRNDSLGLDFMCPTCRAANHKERDCVPDQRNRRKIGEMITKCHRTSCFFVGRCDALDGHACPQPAGRGAATGAAKPACSTPAAAPAAAAPAPATAAPATAPAAAPVALWRQTPWPHVRIPPVVSAAPWQPGPWLAGQPSQPLLQPAAPIAASVAPTPVASAVAPAATAAAADVVSPLRQLTSSLQSSSSLGQQPASPAATSVAPAAADVVSPLWRLAASTSMGALLQPPAPVAAAPPAASGFGFAPAATGGVGGFGSAPPATAALGRSTGTQKYTRRY